MKGLINTVVIFLLLNIATTPFVQAATVAENDLGNDKYEDLAYINNKAKEFISEYNLQHHTNWHSHKPNDKILVAKCAEPLNIKWKYEQEIEVSCKKTNATFKPKWRLLILVSKEPVQ